MSLSNDAGGIATKTFAQRLWTMVKSRELTGLTLLVAPFGASCVLVVALPASPLARPRNVIGGHLIATGAGLCVFTLLGAGPLTLALGVGLAISAMLLTGTLHPPARANPSRGESRKA
jgi:CBS-domain-containing membrane protein